MLSLPLPTPTQPDLLRTNNLFRPRAESPPPRNASGVEQPHRHQHANNSSTQKKQPPPTTHLTPHALLLADESTLAHRKLQIRNFGATWIRPPGVGKTLQAMREEEDEMREMEEMARQEQGLADLRARTAVEEARTQAELTAAGGAGDEVEGEAERDLDDEIPDADAEIQGGDQDELEDVTFNEESIFAEGSAVLHEDDAGVMEEAELTGAARDEEDLGIEHERDLDDSVPEAGSYQHTDTEVEDSSSSSDDDGEGPSELQNSSAAQGAQRDARQRELQQRRQQRQREDGSPVAMSGALQTGLQERIRAQTTAAGAPDADALTRSPGSLNLSSSLLESSFVGSSPVMLRGRGAGGRRRRGRLS